MGFYSVEALMDMCGMVVGDKGKIKSVWDSEQE